MHEEVWAAITFFLTYLVHLFQAFLYMQELKDAEEMVNEYRQHPPKIGWRTIFVQYSQYTRLDVGPKSKPDAQVTHAY